MKTIQRITTHPGEILREEFLIPLGISAHHLSLELRVPASRISEIVKERRAVTADTALRLAKFFGTSPQFWINIQTAYDLSLMEREKKAEIMTIIPLQSTPLHA